MCRSRDEIKARSRKNLVQSRQFSEMLEESIRKYQNRSLQAGEVIQELIDLPASPSSPALALGKRRSQLIST
jgi:hypothetical protein